MTNRLFLLSGYCFRLSYLWLVQWLSDVTTGVSDGAEGPGSSVHFKISFSPLLSWMPSWGIHLQMTELSHNSTAAGCIDLAYGSLWQLYCNFHCSFGSFLLFSLEWPPWIPSLSDRRQLVVQQMRISRNTLSMNIAALHLLVHPPLIKLTSEPGFGS